MTGELPRPVREWNRTRTDYPRESTVARLFEQMATEWPEAIALVQRERQVSYADLNRMANRVAHRLRRMGVREETMVGCALERSVEMIVAFLATLKAGGAYVPLDPTYPRARFEFMVNDTHTPVILTERRLQPSPRKSGVAGPGAQLLLEEALEDASRFDNTNPEPAGGPENLAYVMYTSGSTGRPKGVMIENRAILRLVRNTNYCRFGPQEVFLQFAPASFDASTLEIWGPLLNGGRLVIVPAEAASLPDLGQAIQEHGVTTLWLTSGLFNLMVDEQLEALRGVRQLLAGGDVVSARHVRAVLRRFPDCTVINGYGPTENTTFTCCHAMSAGEAIGETVPIGRPISNTRVYILDGEMRPVPPGEPGELWAAGDGVARGYLSLAEETAERFQADIFAEAFGETQEDPRPKRMYRTGDLGRWREDGVIEFLGRADNQVKILGHRIEPGEIEAALGIHPEIREACVVGVAAEKAGEESGARRLAAFCVPRQQPGPSAAELRKFLAGKVPQYMVPSLFVSVEELPLSPNGKVDRAALIAGSKEAALGGCPDEAARDGNGACGAAGTEMGKSITDLWKRILRAERIGPDENFFDLGGDSLMIVAVHSNLQKQLHIEIAVTDLFEFTTVRTLANRLEELRRAASQAATADASTLSAALSEEQRKAQLQRQAFARVRQRQAAAGSAGGMLAQPAGSSD